MEHRALTKSAWLALAAALVLTRCAVWVFWEQSYFDSDQAVIGLMAKHLAEGRAFPLFFYGQHYMLAVEAWLAAPVFRLLGASVLTLRLPLVALNLVIAALLLHLLRGRAGVSPLEALTASLFFLMPPPIVASRLIEASGGNIEPFLYVLLLWILRDRPVLFGLVGGLAFLNREFAAYAILAIVIVDVLVGRAFDSDRLRRYAVSALGFGAVLLLARALKPHADLLGPGTAGTLDAPVLNAQVTFWMSTLCFRPQELIPNLRWLFSENLPVLFGLNGGPLGEYLVSGLTTGGWWVGIPLIGALAVAVIEIARRRRALALASAAFPIYLALVGIIAASVYATLGCTVRDAMLIRYTLLAIYLPVGIVALFFTVRPSTTARRLVIAGVVSWAACTTVAEARVITEYVRQAPPNPFRALVDELESQGVRYARAPYWTAYRVDFLSGERVMVGTFPGEKVRVQEYQTIFETHVAESLDLFEGGCSAPGEVPFRQWCFVFLDRARHAR